VDVNGVGMVNSLPRTCTHCHEVEGASERCRVMQPVMLLARLVMKPIILLVVDEGKLYWA
jgi:hypothetical protein